MWSIFRVINSSDEEVDLCSSVECKVNFEGFIPQCETLRTLFRYWFFLFLRESLELMEDTTFWISSELFHQMQIFLEVQESFFSLIIHNSFYYFYNTVTCKNSEIRL